MESEPGRGSTFAFTARFGRQPHPPEPVAARPPVLLRDLPVLIVDDNATNRHILEEWLRGWQMEPAAVGDGLAALDALWRAVSPGRPYALVLLDARMPDTDGLALAAQIREQGRAVRHAHHPADLGDRPGDLARARELRIDAHLLKPVQQDELLETIYRVMSRASGNAPTWPGPRPPRKPPSPVPATTPLHILVAEDNEFSANSWSSCWPGGPPRAAGEQRPEVLALAEQGGLRPAAPGRPHAGAGRLPGRPGGPGAGADRGGPPARHRLDARARGKKTASAASRPAWTTS